MSKYIKAYSDIVSHSLPLHKSEVLTQEELVDRFKIIEELIQKEEPMKLGNLRVDTSNEFWWGICQKCRQDIPFNKVLKNINYCDNCGQKIDWSDTD